MTPNVPLLSWTPDADPTIPGVMVDVENMLPTTRGYAPDYELTDTVNSVGTLPSTCRGANYVRFSTLTAMTFAGTETAVYVSWGGSLIDLSRAAAYTAVTDAYLGWRFDAFGDVALCVSRDNQLQSTANPAGGTDFANVSGAPSGSTMCVQSNFVMLGGFFGGSWPYADGWWCSALEDYTDWTPDVATQCVQGRLLQTPGAVLRMIAFGNYVIAFKQGSMLRGTYIGAPQVWRWDVISTSVGLVGHDAVCDAEGVLYWLAEDGFYRFAGGAPQRIASAPWRWFQSQLYDSLYLARAQAHWDPARRVVRWYYPSDVSNALNAGLAYHPQTDRWGRFTQTIEWATNSLREYCGLDVAGETYNRVPNAAVVVDSNHELQCYATDIANSSFTTGDIGDDEAVTGNFSARVRFVQAPASSSATHYHRMVLSDALTTGTTTTRSDGKYDLAAASRWHRLKFSQTGMCEPIGFSVDVKPAGRR